MIKAFVETDAQSPMEQLTKVQLIVGFSESSSHRDSSIGSQVRLNPNIIECVSALTGDMMKRIIM